MYLKTIMISLLVRTFYIGIFVYLGLGLYLYFIQRSLLYYPVVEEENGLQQMVFENNGLKIKTTVLNAGRKKAILYFGGNAENVDMNASHFSGLFPEHSVYLMKYRGYAGSEGKTSESGLYSDAVKLYDLIKGRHENLSVVGRSLGSGVATYVASERVVEKCALITPYDSIQSVAQARFILYPMGLLLKDKFDSLGRVHRIKVNTLVVAAEFDAVIGLVHTQRLVEGFAKENVAFEVISGANHNNISSMKAFDNLLAKYFY